MAAQSEGGGKDDIKTQFVTREGTYRLMTLSEYSRPNRVAYNGQQNTPVKVSFINLRDQSGQGDRICFNIGRELYFYMYKGVRKAADLTKPIDKRVYKGTFPTCHDFNEFSATPDTVMLLVGFTAGQVQLIDPITKELSKLYNEERLIDKTKVTCIKWIPKSTNQFLVSHASGQMYLYNEDLSCGATPPNYQPFKQGDSFSVHTCKTKSTRNPLYRWVVGEGGVNEFAFSPCAKYLAVVSQDGYLRVFNYHSMELVGTMKSYFGGLLCVCWSPDGKYIVAGGEDDLVTVWSFHERRVVCRGVGHRSWINVVAFDPYTTSLGDTEGTDFSGSDDDSAGHPGSRSSHNLLQDTLRSSTRSNSSKTSGRNSMSGDSKPIVSYRFGSVGQDTVLCLWDLTEDILRQPVGRVRTSAVITTQNASGQPQQTQQTQNQQQPKCINSVPHSKPPFGGKDAPVMDGNMHDMHHHHTPISSMSTNLPQKFATLTLVERRGDKDPEKKEHKRILSLPNRGNEKLPAAKANHVPPVDEALRMLGTSSCPRLDDVPLLEPLVHKKIAHERLTVLIFREECLVTACQEGYVCTWARPGKVGINKEHHLHHQQHQQPHHVHHPPSARPGGGEFTRPKGLGSYSTNV